MFGACRPGAFSAGGLFTLFTPIKILISSFDALTPSGHFAGRAGPLLSGQQKVGKDWPKRAAPPLGFPLAVALECLRHNRAPKEAIKSGFGGTPRRFAAGASGRFAKALPQKPLRTRYHARSRMIGRCSLMGNAGGQGASAPTLKRWRCGGCGERACARGLPQRHRSSSREAARSSANPDSAARLGGFQRGASSTPLWSGDPQGGETPLRLSFAYFSAGAEK